MVLVSFAVIINVETVLIFLWKLYYIYFFINFLFEIEIFCNIVIAITIDLMHPWRFYSPQTNFFLAVVDHFLATQLAKVMPFNSNHVTLTRSLEWRHLMGSWAKKREKKSIVACFQPRWREMQFCSLSLLQLLKQAQESLTPSLSYSLSSYLVAVMKVLCVLLWQ